VNRFIKVLLIGVVASHFANTAHGEEDIMSYLSCKVLGHSTIMVKGGEMLQSPGGSNLAEIGARLGLNLHFDTRLNVLKMVGYVKNTKTNFQYVGVLEKRHKLVQEEYPLHLRFKDAHVSNDIFELEFGQVLSLRKVGDKKWDGNLVELRPLPEPVPYVTVTALSCHNLDSGISRLYDWLLDEGY